MTTLGPLITAMITPFNTDESVNYDEAIRIAKHLVDTGTDCILLSGTTGESPTLTHDEEFALYRTIISELPNTPIMVGTGSNCTKTAIRSTQEAEKLGAHASLQVVPYYNKPSQDGLFAHFKAIADNTSLPIMLYNIPGRTGTNMTPETIAKLAEIPNIFALKEAAGSVEQFKQINKLVPSDFQLYSGDDGLTLEFMKNGAVGVVSVASHIAGKKISAMITAYSRGDMQTAQSLHDKLSTLFDVLFITSNPSPVKYALSTLGFNPGNPRLPLIPVTAAEQRQIDSVLQSQ